mgnify:CR=1 FL=1
MEELDSAGWQWFVRYGTDWTELRSRASKRLRSEGFGMSQVVQLKLRFEEITTAAVLAS